MMLNTGSATAQSGITPSNSQVVPTYHPVKEDLQKFGELFKDVYDAFKEGRKRRQIVGNTTTEFMTNARVQFDNRNNNSGSSYFSTLKVKSELQEFVKSIKSDGFSKLKIFVLAAASATKGMMTATGGKDFTKDTLKVMGSAHLIGAALLVVVVLLERWEMFSANKEERLDLLENMADLVSHLYQISDRSTENSQMGDCHLQEIIRECMETIMDGYDLIWSKLEAAKIKRFFNAKTEKEELAKLKHQMDNKYCKLMRQITIDLLRIAPNARPHYFKFPEEAVVSLEEVTKVIDQMKWEDDEKALAVVLQGHSGSGKTTLGDAVCSHIYVNKPRGFPSDGRCAVVTLFKGMDPCKIMQAQRILINDLENSNFNPKTTKEGRNKIADVLQRTPAYIYIDEVKSDEELKELLPGDLYNAKKLRLLLTCCDYSHCLTLTLSGPPVFHRIKPLSEQAATEFIDKRLGNGGLFNDTIRKEIAGMCRGIPKLLKDVVALLFNRGKEGLEIVRNQYKNCYDTFGPKLDSMLGLKELEDEERDALLDILYFFKQENWDEVKRIVRADILDKLACKSLVEKTHQEAIKIDDVLSYITEKEARKTRFTTEQQIQKFLKAEHHPHRLEGIIKGISVPSTMDIAIPCTLLDHVQGSIRVLKLGMKGKIKGECEESFEKLIYLDCCLFIHLETPNLRCLRLLSDIPDIEVNLSTFWPAEFEDLQELREIQISGYYLKTLPNDLDLLKELQVLKLSCCHDLKDLGSGFFHLSETIKLFLCDHLKSRMEHIISGLNYVNISCHVNASI